eukprot:augustus_masked-scaffold_36-processed-gene-2.19-mRNA-1 protein AED:1.00 eAED:1.00 QI:0/-1/0/0/-1/1/1/0/354
MKYNRYLYKTPFKSVTHYKSSRKRRTWKELIKRSIQKNIEYGVITQSNHHGDKLKKHGTHYDVLSHAWDVFLPVGTKVLAARSGVVVDFGVHFEEGGLKETLRSCANFLVLRHADGTYGRYYHLKHNGVLVKLGQHVRTAEVIAESGNTGYTSGPHLHFDVVDSCLKETARFAVTFSNEKGSFIEDIPCSLANFSKHLARTLEFEKFDFYEERVEGAVSDKRILFWDRDSHTFLKKSEICKELGYSCLVILDNDSSKKDVLHQIGSDVAQFDTKTEKKRHLLSLCEMLDLPVVFLSYSVSVELKKKLKTNRVVSFELREHENYRKGRYPYSMPETIPIHFQTYLESTAGKLIYN